MIRFAVGSILPAEQAFEAAKLQCPQILQERMSGNPSVMQQRLSAYLLLAELYTTPLPQICWDLNGKPVFVDCPLYFSISHTGTGAAAVIADIPVGIDLQKTIAVSNALLERVCIDSEWIFCNGGIDRADQNDRFTHIWTAKEAMAKADGLGLARLGLKRILVDVPNQIGQANGRSYDLDFPSVDLPNTVCCIAKLTK